MLRKYLDAGNEDRLYEEESDIIDRLKEKATFDYELASARLLGRDMRAIVRRETAQELMEILELETGEKGQYKLVQAMTDTTAIDSAGDFERYLKLLEELKLGFIEGPQGDTLDAASQSNCE